jgi:hypothetical protein
MAKEINCSIKVSIASKGGSKASGDISSIEDLSAGCVGFQATVGSSSAAAINIGIGGVPKVLYIQNNDPDNFVDIDNVVTLDGWPQRILPGTGILLRPVSATIYGKADTAPVPVWIVAG